MFHYQRDPERIEQQTYEKIRELVPLEQFTPDQQQVVLPVIRACGEPLIAERLRFSPQAIETAKKAIRHYAPILYDFDTVTSGLQSDLLYQEPLSFINKAVVISQAKAKKQTRSMTSIEYWRKYLAGAICLLGESSTALFRLLEMLKEEDASRPALIIATPAGFLQTTEAKQLLMDLYDELAVEYILIEGRWGGSMFATSIMNALLRIQKGIHL
ncbi:MAG: precorrin-8X methylmutase [Thiofilum sp.]|uniref:precorrin-8X methylmutase n=1 Tax=Thiofilum sp. TaxID=2212733 RepID=UPI0025D7F04F|nr:precorrin-8X methylmutase [Thiofilum sp.]MBK8452638.1 precorrin-8X methylmutase [Thiofilum sp.]